MGEFSARSVCHCGSAAQLPSCMAVADVGLGGWEMLQAVDPEMMPEMELARDVTQNGQHAPAEREAQVCKLIMVSS